MGAPELCGKRSQGVKSTDKSVCATLMEKHDLAGDRLLRLFVDFAFFHDEGDVLDGVDVVERVAGGGDDVGVFAGVDEIGRASCRERVLVAV